MVTLGPRKYSERLGVIDGKQLQQACDLFDLGTVKGAEPPSAGLWGQNILLSTTNGEFVLRGNPQSPQQFPKERVVAAAINARSSLPVPWPYHVSNDLDPFGWAFAIMPLLPGTMGSSIWEAVDDEIKLGLAAAHGQALAQLHEATFDAPGPYDPERETFVATDDFRGWTLDRIESLRGQCRAIDALSADAERYIDGLIESCSDALAEPFVPVLVHHDFSLANTNYEPFEDDYRATGLFDLGEAHVGDGEEDLVRFLFRRRREQRRAFVAAYTNERPLRAGAGDRLSIYALADLLFMWEVSQRITNWFGGASFNDTAEPIIDNARIAASC
jgi:aminoglycoside phosphotransferase (APT) family kinase protein